MKPALPTALLLAITTNPVAAGDRYGFVQGDRLEYRESSESTLWDLQGWYGDDYHKLWIKTEGEIEGGSTSGAELQVLYSRAWSAYFDLQFGVRYEDLSIGDAVSLVAGIQGMAPYRIEIDAAAFVSDDGEIALRAEFERDFLLSEKWVLQPRAEFELDSGSDDEFALGLRLRYEFRRKLAPYVGVSYDSHPDDTTLVAGLRFWF